MDLRNQVRYSLGLGLGATEVVRAAGIEGASPWESSVGSCGCTRISAADLTLQTDGRVRGTAMLIQKPMYICYPKGARRWYCVRADLFLIPKLF